MLCALSAALLTGCAGNEAFLAQQESITPQSWVAGVPVLESVPHGTADWWQAWHNPELTALIERADRANTDILTALANLRSAAALADEATSALFPTLDLSAKGSSTRANNRTTESYQAGASYNWSLSLAGGNIAAKRAARHEAMAAHLTLEDTRILVAGEVAQNYVALALAHVKKEIAEKTLDNYRRALEIARWNNEAGLTDRTELEQAFSNMQQARASIPLMDQSIAKYRNALARLTGQSAADIRLTSVDTVPSAPMTLAVALPADTLRQRPDMRAAQMSLAAASERVYQARSQWFPQLSISGNLGTQAATISALGASGTGLVTLIGALSMPLLNWGEQVSATEQKLAALDKARAQYTATLVGALEETENALTAIRTAQTRESALALARTSAETAADLAMQQYRAGLVDYQTVLSTQRTLLSAREGYQSNKADLANGLITLYRALGGGWKPTEEIADELARTEAPKQTRVSGS